MLLKKTLKKRDKYQAEASFWEKEIDTYIKWYNGKIDELYGCPPPTVNQKIKVRNVKDSAILTWLELHQKPKYLYDLSLSENIFRGKTILDIGSGPFPSASVFKNCKLYCLDPLLHKYLECGYPLHYYAENIRFIHGYSENIPIEDDFFDVVVAVNAIDHVDDLEKTAKELYRVLKRDGKLAMHVHYHKPCPEEPLEINDAIFLNAFSWCKNFKKIKETKEKFGYKLKVKDEKYVLWRNF